jgi:hypothetical protein
VVAASASPGCFRAVRLLPARLQVRVALGTADVITDLGAYVDPARDRIRGPARAPVTIVEYGDFECPCSGQAESVLRELLAGHGDVRYAWRHLPLNDVHPPMPSSPPRPRKPPSARARSGRCMTCSCAIRTASSCAT